MKSLALGRRIPTPLRQCAFALTLTLISWSGWSPTVEAAPNPPPGFVALFNEQDLAGWRGGDTFDHRKYLALTPEARAKQDA